VTRVEERGTQGWKDSRQ